MPGARSRQGCDECRRRRRKCDEQKPRCSQCSNFSRTCEYTLRLVLQGGTNPARDARQKQPQDNSTSVMTTKWLELPRCLPNGIPLTPPYQKLLLHFTQDILASLSCHPSIHLDLGRGLVPAALESPQLMSACLALSAAGFLSRNVLDLDGIEMVKILGHLQSSGLALLRSALATTTDAWQKAMDDTLLATCLIWCLADVFTYRRFDGTLSSSWRVHLQGMRALLDRNGTHRRHLSTGTGTSTQMAMKHLHQLYLSLQTLPYITPAASEGPVPEPTQPMHQLSPATSPTIDGFLGYSDELLDVMRQIDQLSRASRLSGSGSAFEADVLLGKVQAMIARDAISSPPVILSPSSIASSLSPSSASSLTSSCWEFTLCHQIFQQATLIQLHRRLHHLPSRSPQIQAAVSTMQGMLASLPYNTTTSSTSAPLTSSPGGGESMWVAMAMPVFTLGCEAYTLDQQAFVLDKMDRLEACIRSLHTKIIRQALGDVWGLRRGIRDEGEMGGRVCAGGLLGEFSFSFFFFSSIGK